jgi:hypothetical protein
MKPNESKMDTHFKKTHPLKISSILTIWLYPINTTYYFYLHIMKLIIYIYI